MVRELLSTIGDSITGHWGNFLSAMVDFLGAGGASRLIGHLPETGGQKDQRHTPAPLL